MLDAGTGEVPTFFTSAVNVMSSATVGSVNDRVKLEMTRLPLVPVAVIVCGLLVTSLVVTWIVFTPAPRRHVTAATPVPSVIDGQELPSLHVPVLTVPPPPVTANVTDCPTTG